MRTSNLVLAGLAAAAVVTASLVIGQPKTSPQQPAPSVQPPSAAANVQVERGRYLVALGDCVACHTQQGGARFAGGRKVQTPFGTILSANITPDADTGIGHWTPEQFYRALHEGVDDEGHHLYPAFPYNYYSGVVREDSDAMLAYLRTVPPVQHGFERNQLPFPFNMRFLLVFWNWLFLDKGPYQPDTAKSAQWNRGAYLVQTLGHCQACHTPKNALGGPKKNSAFRGGSFGDWFAPDITANRRTGIGGWDDDSLREFLRQGSNVHSAASGEMGEVVAFSTSQMSEADLQAVITYLRDLPASPEPQVRAVESAVMKQGEAIWRDNCSACHRGDGSGVPRLFPPLRQNANVQQSDPTSVLHFILAGTRKVPTDRAPTPFSMPAYDWKLDDQQVAAVATYVRNSWGNHAAPVGSDMVAKLRTHLHRVQQPPAQAPTGIAHPGPNTFAPGGSDSRDNGTAQAGQAARDTALIPATQGGSGSTGALGGGAKGGGSGGGGSGSGGTAPRQQKGHPGGVPTPG
jgi:mono/diheme cytochrome c family protein